MSAEWQIHMNEEELRGTVYLAEAMPFSQFRHGSALPFLAVLAGGDYEYHDSSWIKPMPDVLDRPLPRFDQAHPQIRAAEAILKRLADAVGRRAYVNAPPLLDAMTTLSMFRTAEQLAVDLIERPDEVLAWNAAGTDLYIATCRHFHRFLSDLGYGETSSWLSDMAEGAMEAVQCDFAVMLSPAMFKRFVLPDLRRTTEALDYSLYHLDGVCQMRFLDQLRSCPKLNGIQWNPEPGVGSPSKSLAELKEIQRRGFCLHLGCWNPKEAAFLAKELSPDGLLLWMGKFETEAEALAAIELVEKACR
jgi:hypothetical protein